jgi:hypothetical protein
MRLRGLMTYEARWLQPRVVHDRLLLNAILKEINHVEPHQTQAGDRKRGRFRLK